MVCAYGSCVRGLAFFEAKEHGTLEKYNRISIIRLHIQEAQRHYRPLAVGKLQVQLEALNLGLTCRWDQSQSLTNRSYPLPTESCMRAQTQIQVLISENIHHTNNTMALSRGCWTIPQVHLSKACLCRLQLITIRTSTLG